MGSREGKGKNSNHDRMNMCDWRLNGSTNFDDEDSCHAKKTPFDFDFHTSGVSFSTRIALGNRLFPLRISHKQLPNILSFG